jgi:hypothetical protein
MYLTIRSLTNLNWKGVRGPSASQEKANALLRHHLILQLIGTLQARFPWQCEHLVVGSQSQESQIAQIREQEIKKIATNSTIKYIES